MDMKEQSIYGPNYAYSEYMLISRSCEMKGRIMETFPSLHKTVQDS